MHVYALAALVAVGLFALAVRWLRRTPVEPMRYGCGQIDTSRYDYENDVEIPAA